MSAPRKLLLLGWDSADWKLFKPLLEAGQLPNLARLVEQGCMGSISTLHPVYSPMLWTSIATGKRPYQHGVLGFSEPLPDGTGVRPVSSLSRRCRAFWNIFHQQGWTGHVVGWWPSHPAEPIRGSMISNLCHRAVAPPDRPWPVPPGGMHPPELVETFADLRFNPNELTVDMVAAFIPKVREIDQAKDQRLAGFMRTLAECVTVHNWGLWLAEHTQWDYLCVYYDALDHFGHGFMKYHPPQQKGISDRDFELYSNVLTEAAKFHDRMLGALLAKVPPETTVVLLSDHGFHPDALRPTSIAPIPAGPAAEHSDFGILVVRGPDFKKDELLHGASILDLTPTLLALQGLPLGEDMDGRPLLGAWKQPPVVKYIPSWDDVPGDDGRHPPEYQQDPESEQAALAQLVALGYVAKPPANAAQHVAQTQRELDFNLAEAFMDGGRDGDALPILERLNREFPEEYRFALRLAMCCRALGRMDDLRRVVKDLDEVRRPATEAARAELKIWREEVQQRIAARREAAAQAKTETAAKNARQETSAAPEIGPQDELGADDHGAAVEAEVAAEEQQRPGPLLTHEERAEIAALRKRAGLNLHGVSFLKGILALADKQGTLALHHLNEAARSMSNRPGIHLQTGQAYARLGQWNDARRAFDRALELDPANPHALVGLSRVSLGERRFEEAAGFALAAIQRLHHYPLAHFLLGLALGRLNHFERALTAWETTLQLNPNYWPAHVRLARACRKGAPRKAAFHREQVRRIRADAAEHAQNPRPENRPQLHPPAHTPARPPRVEVSPEFAPEVMGLARPPFGETVITVVTGLPRSGTSLLMQMLTRGGLAPLTDGQRLADDDNPRGYFEMEAVKSLARDTSCLDQAGGKVVKIVLPLLSHLPPKHHYHVIFIERDLDELFASQAAMLKRAGKDDGGAAPEKLRPAYERLLRQSRQLVAGHPRIRALRLSHRWLLQNPAAGAQAMTDFLGHPLDRAQMAVAVDPTLHRQKRP
jgi:predicted AlkP superfamily phosphohydrolase/phosphomutase/tetratricopeptide (TPR) repeat protein